MTTTLFDRIWNTIDYANGWRAHVVTPESWVIVHVTETGEHDIELHGWMKDRVSAQLLVRFEGITASELTFTAAEFDHLHRKGTELEERHHDAMLKHLYNHCAYPAERSVLVRILDDSPVGGSDDPEPQLEGEVDS